MTAETRSNRDNPRHGFRGFSPTLTCLRSVEIRAHPWQAGFPVAFAAPSPRLANSEQTVLFPLLRQPEVLIGQLRGHAPARCAVEEANLDEERFVDFFDCLGLFRQGGCQRVHA